MKNLQQLMFAALVVATTQATTFAGIVIDASLRGITAASVSQGSDVRSFPGPGFYSDSVSIVTDSGRAYSASQTSNLDPTGHFWGSGSAESTHAYFDGFSTAYGRTFYSVEFTIDTPYLFTLTSTIFSNFFDPNISGSLAALVHPQSATLFAGNFGTIGQVDNGILAPGSYLLSIDEYAFATDHTTNFEFDFKLTDPNNHVVPEPASIAVWACLGLTAGGLKWRRRGKNSNAAA